MTKQGLKVLADSLSLSRQRKIKAKITQIQNKLKTKAVQGDKSSKGYYTEMLALYKDCLSKNITVEYISDLEFLATGNRLKVFTDRCSAHYNMAMDELWTFEYVLNLKSWQKYLTTYGQTIAEI